MSTAQALTLGEFAVAMGALTRWECRPFLAVAVSGGPDSLALAILADRWARKRGGEVCAVTVDHRLRPESGAEIRRLDGWLSVRAIRHEILVWSGAKPVTGLQEAARAARYSLLAGWCREHGCLHLLTAHHREDQVETHLIRRRAGSRAVGLAGMSAIRELAGCRILRPLLGIAKARLVALLDAERQPFIADPSNRDPAFERSRLRSEGGSMSVGAELEAQLHAIRELGYERTAHERSRDQLLARAVILHPAGFAVLDPARVLEVRREIAEGVLAATAITVGGRYYPPRREQVARLREVLSGPVRRGHTLAGCCFVPWRGRILVIRELAAAAKPIRLSAGTRCSWDSRFSVALPATANGTVAVGYLGHAEFAGLGRFGAQLPSGNLPRLIYPTLPAVWDDQGLAAVPDLGYRREEEMLLPQLRFQPINPLTRAAFTVV